MFGKLAKGVFGAEQEGDSLGVRVETLLARAADGVLAQDRAEALASLSELLQGSEQAQKIIGMNGLPVLTAVLRDDAGERELLRGALECLNVALSLSPDGDRQSASAMNAELFARGPGNAQLLLGLLSSGDSVVRCHAVQLLTALAAGGARAHRLAEAALASPGGAAQLTQLLTDRHEAVRNEALLLLGGLARAHPALRRAAAAEGALQHALAILRQEGGVEGGIVVQDCLELLGCLLRGEPPAQQALREAGGLQQLLEQLRLPESGFARKLPRQKAANVLSLLECLTLLLAEPAGGSSPPAAAAAGAAGAAAEPEPPHRQNQAALLQVGLLDRLLMLALKGDDPSAQAIRTQALLCLAHLIAGFQPARERLVMSGLGWLRGTPALRQVLRLCLHSQAAAEAAAASAVIRAFCAGNAEGQAMLAATLVPVADQDPGNTTFGGEIVRAFQQPGLAASSRAAAVLTCMLAGNDSVKQRLLRMPLELGPQPRPLLAHCVAHLSAAVLHPGGGEQAAAAVLLRLLVSWLCDCPPAVAAFAADAARLPFLAELVTGRRGTGSAAVSGLAALLLGVCLVSEQGGGDGAVLDCITTGVGLAPFFAALDGLLAEPAFRAALAGPRQERPAVRAPAPAPVLTEEEDEPAAAAQANGGAAAALSSAFDPSFARWAAGFVPAVRQRVIGGGEPQQQQPRQPRLQQLGGLAPEQQLQQALAAVAGLEREVESLKARNRALTQQAIELGPSAANGGSSSSQPGAAAPGPLHAELAAAKAAAERAERRAEAAEAQAAGLRTEAEGLRGELRQAAQQRQALESRLAEATRDAEEAGAAAAKYEADLEALSSAYTGLEAHAHELEARLAGGGSGNSAAQPQQQQQQDGGGGSQGEASPELDDLLACLGEEELRVERLKGKLLELGVDPEPLIADIGGGGSSGGSEAEAGQDFT